MAPNNPYRMNISKLLLHFFIGLSLALTSACVHVSTSENKSLDLESPNFKQKSESKTQAPLKTEAIIYNQSKYPLSKFFKKLMAGELKDAIAKVDLNYVPSNSDNTILKELIDDGYVPVLVRIENPTSEAMQIDESSFTLNYNQGSYSAIPSGDVPREFKRLNPNAIAANIYNVSAIVVTGSVILLTAAAGNKGGYVEPTLFFEKDPIKSNVINNTMKTTHINYQNLLMSSRTLNPGKKTQGLLFFRNTKDLDINDLKLETR